MWPKLIVLLPSSCEVPEICGGGSDGVPAIQKEGSISIMAAHGDKSRPYNPTVYSIDIREEVSNGSTNLLFSSPVLQNKLLCSIASSFVRDYLSWLERSVWQITQSAASINSTAAAIQHSVSNKYNF